MTSTSEPLDDPVRRPVTERRALRRLPAAVITHRRWATAQNTYIAATSLACVAALAFGLWLGGIWPQSRLIRLIDTDAVTAWGLPVSQLAVDLSAVGTVGMLVTGILLPLSEQRDLGSTARRCLRGAVWLALAWAVATAAMLLYTSSDITALPVTRLPVTKVFSGPDALPEAVPYLSCAVLGLVISAASTVTVTRRGALIVLGLAAYNLLPLTTQGHAGHSAVTAYALTAHVLALTLWVGGLAGLMIHVRGSVDLLAVAVPRFSRLALACFVTVGASGIIMGWTNLGSLAELWRSRYGLLLLCKATSLITLGTFGWWHRRRTVRAVAHGRGRRAFVRLAAVEIAVMLATVALGVALSRTATPATTSRVSHVHATGPQHAGPGFSESGRTRTPA